MGKCKVLVPQVRELGENSKNNGIHWCSSPGPDAEVSQKCISQDTSVAKCSMEKDFVVTSVWETRHSDPTPAKSQCTLAYSCSREAPRGEARVTCSNEPWSNAFDHRTLLSSNTIDIPPNQCLNVSLGNADLSLLKENLDSQLPWMQDWKTKPTLNGIQRKCLQSRNN